MSVTCAFISSIISCVITGLPFSERPSSISVSASAIHSLLQVENFMSGEKIYCILLLA